MTPQFDDIITPMGLVLLCPECRGIYLHHDMVETYYREEDEEEGMHTESTPLGTVTDASMAGNPSPHSGGLTIRLWCEECSAVSYLRIYQFKGCTFMTTELDQALTDVRRARIDDIERKYP